MKEDWKNRGGEKLKMKFELQNLTFEGCLEVKMIFKSILGVPATILAQFPFRIILFSITINPNGPKSFKIYVFNRKSPFGAYCNVDP